MLGCCFKMLGNSILSSSSPSSVSPWQLNCKWHLQFRFSLHAHASLQGSESANVDAVPTRMAYDEPMPGNLKRASRKAVSVALRIECSQEDSAQRMIAKGSNRLLPRSLLEILTDRIHRGQWQFALKVFDLMRLQQWYQGHPGTYIKLFQMLGRCRQPDQAPALYEKMLKDGCKPSRQVFTAIISTYTRSGMLDKAFEIFQEMKSRPICFPDVFTYSLMIKACCDRGLFARANELLQEMQFNRVEPNTVTYNTLLDAYGKAGMLTEMEDTLKTMMSRETCKPDVWTSNAIVRNFGLNGKIDKMEYWYTKMSNFGIQPDSVTLNSLMSAYGKEQMFEKMLSVLTYIKKYRYEQSSVNYNILLDAYGRSGNIQEMEQIFRKRKSEGVKADSVTFCTLINAYGKWGLERRVPKILRQLQNSDVVPDAAVYNSALDAYKRAGKLDWMEFLYKEMKKEGCNPDKVTFNIMISAYRGSHEFDKAEKLLLELQKL